MKNRFKFVESCGNRNKSFVISFKDIKDGLDFYEQFFKEVMTDGFLPSIYQDKGGVWKQVG